jgi:UDP-glucose 4-epimerase
MSMTTLLQEQNTNLIYGSASWKKLYSKWVIHFWQLSVEELFTQPVQYIENGIVSTRLLAAVIRTKGVHPLLIPIDLVMCVW